MAPACPRIPPGSYREVGLVNHVITTVIAAATGGRAPNLFTTLARHRRLYRPWLRFAAALMPRGALPRQDSELVILRVATNCGCEYERRHHTELALRQGLTHADIQRVAAGPAAEGWGRRQAALLHVADELHERRDLSEDSWIEVSALLSETELIELPMLVGHYEMLAMTLNSLRVAPDEPAARPRGALGRLSVALTTAGARGGRRQ